MSTTGDAPASNIFIEITDLYLAWYWKFFNDMYWPQIQKAISEEWVLPVLFIGVGFVNLVIVTLKTTGFNFIAIGANALKGTL